MAFHVGGVDYSRPESVRLREALIDVRAAAMPFLPEAAPSVMLFTHVIGWMYEATNAIWPDESEARDVQG
ncbi:MAG: hypothetical protein JWO67_6497 [Streptosporangiaceae bacterium]|nr:hypothetical protein [Streptosporangiaceae bacterium]